MKRISVIIPFYNEEKYIKKCLESIIKQSRKVDEIIVVDDGSTDASASVISNFKFQISNFKIIKQKHHGPAVARNLGASHAKGDILVFLDADMVYDKNYVKELIQPIIEKREIATFTRSEYVTNLDNVWSRLWDDVTYSNTGKRSVIGRKERETAFRAILASAFSKAGEFDSFGFSDDASVLEKLGKTSISVDRAVCYHYNPSSLKEVFYSARWMGRDSNNRGKFVRFLIFSPVWSFVKGVMESVKKKDVYFLPFRLAFGLGYFIGLVDVHARGIHYK